MGKRGFPADIKRNMRFLYEWENAPYGKGHRDEIARRYGFASNASARVVAWRLRHTGRTSPAPPIDTDR